MINTIEEMKDAILEMKIPFEEICKEICDTDWNAKAKTFYDMEMDELDVIAVVIEIEKRFGIKISDHCVDTMLSERPHSLVEMSRRNDRLDELGI